MAFAVKKKGKKTSPISTSPGRQGPIFSGLRSPLHFPTAGAFNLVWPSCHLFFFHFSSRAFTCLTPSRNPPPLLCLPNKHPRPVCPPKYASAAVPEPGPSPKLVWHQTHASARDTCVEERRKRWATDAGREIRGILQGFLSEEVGLELEYTGHQKAVSDIWSTLRDNGVHPATCVAKLAQLQVCGC